jgi:hypothetical protein
MEFNKLIVLLNEFKNNPSKMIDHRQRDDTGKLQAHNKDDPNSWFMKMIKTTFPNEPFSCYALGTCIRHLIELHVTSTKELIIIAPLLKQVGKYIAAREAQYFSDITKALTKNKKRSAEFRELAKKLFVQTPAEKKLDAEINPSKLDMFLSEPLQFNLPFVLATIISNLESVDRPEMGITLELIFGTRSIDLINEEIAEVTVCKTNPMMLTITGHSKIRSGEKLLDVLSTPRDFYPNGCSPIQALKLLYRYRVLCSPDIEWVKDKFQVEIDDLPPLERIHFINEKLTYIFNASLVKAAHTMFPEQALVADKRGQRFGSHIARALSINMSIILYMPQGSSRDMYMRDHLQHTGFGSTVNYKQVVFNEVGAGGYVSSDAKEVSNKLIVHIAEFKSDILDQKKEIDTLRLEIDELKTSRGIPVIPQTKKRKTAPHRAIGEVVVTLIDVDGNQHDLIRINRGMPNSTEKQKQERVDIVEKILAEHKIENTYKNMQKMGIGTRSIKLLRTGNSNKGEMLAGDYSKEKKRKLEKIQV